MYAKTVIDATGDGDIFRYSGAPYSTLADGKQVKYHGARMAHRRY